MDLVGPRSRIIHPMPRIAPPRHSVLVQLIAAYPVFRDAQPLAIGIHKTIMAAHPEIDKGALRMTLQRHTASTKYLKAVASGSVRFGIDGMPAGDITQEQKQQANQCLKERFRKQAEQHRDEQKALERQAKLYQLVDKFKQR
jgi:ProP effector